MKKTNVNKVRLNLFVFISFLLFFILIFYRMIFISLSTTIDHVNIKEFAKNRNTSKSTIHAKRGNIYDKNNEILVQTINSYTVIAYLSDSRSEGFKTPQHVVDKEKTAKELSEIINMKEETILKLLNQKVYQVELGPGGRDISELKKQRIEELNLEGIDFVKSYKRYYPNNDFASYVLGYVQNVDDELIGEMGIEQKYDKILKGEDGYREYQQDISGYKIPNTPEIERKSINGADIYLTLDSNIQFFSERNTKASFEKYNPEWIVTVVASAKTGEILSSTSYPSFDPNKRNITNYLNPLTSFVYEPGSTMKIYTYMALMEKGLYNPDTKFKSGIVKVANATVYDWYKPGWGTLTYKEGFTVSANTAVASILTNELKREELREFFEKVGFGEKTNIELLGEKEGSLSFYYPIETISAGFGQKINSTVIQNIKALTPVANKGNLLEPYLVKKIIKDNKIIYEKEPQKENIVISNDTAETMKNLMHDVVNGDKYATGSAFKTENIKLIGKTGTAQYINPYTKAYYSDGLNYIRSFIGMFPYEDPEYIIYVVAKRPYNGSLAISDTVKNIVNDIANYKGISVENEKINLFEMPNLLNKDISEIKDLKEKTNNIILIGNSSKIINQYPKEKTLINNRDKVFILTNKETILNLKNYSLKELKIIADLLNYKLVYENTGFVETYEIKDGTIHAVLKNAFNE